MIEASLPASGLGFNPEDMMLAPEGRADAFGVGTVSESDPMGE